MELQIAWVVAATGYLLDTFKGTRTHAQPASFKMPESLMDTQGCKKLGRGELDTATGRPSPEARAQEDPTT